MFRRKRGSRPTKWNSRERGAPSAARRVEQPAVANSDLKNPNYECFILAISLLSLVNAALILFVPDGEFEQIILVVDVGLSTVLAFDFLYRLLSAPSRSRY